MKYPILYKSNETDFFTMGLGPIEMLKATVTQERNGIFIFEGEILTDNPLFPLVLENCIIKVDADHLLKDQRFRIKRIVPNHSGKAEIYAEHVSYLSRELTIKPEVNITGSAQIALNQWKASIVEANPFVASSDITTSASTKWRIDKVSNPMMALGGVEGSILDRWGGEYLFDNYHISLLKKRGKTATNILAYGRNITDFEQERNILSTYTSIAPYAIYTDDREKEIVVTVDGFVVDSEHVNKFPNRVTKPIDFSSEFGRDEIPTKARLATLAQQYIEDNEIGVPTTSIKISFLDLSQTADYADYAFLEQVNLCDDVRVHYPKLGVNTIAKVVRVVWNCLTESYDEIEIGQKRMSLASQIQEQNKVIQEINTQTNFAMTSADGKNTIFHGLYGQDGLGEPTAIKVGDTWFKPNGTGTDILTWTGTVWQLVFDAKTFDDIGVKVDEMEQEVQNAVDQSNTAINNANQAVEDAGFSKTLAEEAKSLGITASSLASEAKTNANTAMTDAQEAIRQVELNEGVVADASADATEAKRLAGLAEGNAQEALTKANASVTDASKALTDATKAFNKSFKSSAIAYATSTNGSTPPSTGWGTTVPTPSPDVYIWTRTTILLNDNTPVVSYSVGKIGAKGDKGLKGETGATGGQGIQGIPGVNAPTIKSVVQQYYLSTSKTTQTGGSWVSTVPVWSSGKYYWVRVVTTYSNDTTSTSTPVLDNALNDSLVTALEVKTANQNLSTTVTQHATLIEGKANTTTVDAIAGRVTTAEGSISTIAGKVELKANSTDVQTLTGRVTTAEGKITTQAGQIALKANTTTVSALTGRLSAAESALTVQSGKIDLAATKTELTKAIDGIQVGGRNLLPSSYLLDNANTKEFTVSGWATPLVSNEHLKNILVEGETYTLSYEAELIERTSVPTLYSYQAGFLLHSPTGSNVSFYSGVKAKGEKAKVSITFTCPTLDDNHRILYYTNRYTTNGSSPTGLDTITFTNLKLEKGNKATDWTPAPEDVDSAISTVQANLTVEAGKIASKVSKTDFDALNGRVGTAESTITQHATAINLRATKTDVNTLTGRVTTAEGNITTQAGQIALKANQSTVDTLTGRVSTTEAKITATDGKVTTLTTKTDGNTTSIGKLQTGYDGLSSTVTALETGKVGTTAFSALEQNLSGFKTTVANTYAEQSQVTQLAGQWSATVAKVDGHTGQITNLGTDINLRVKKNEVISQINLSTEGVLIQGKNIWLDGNTKINDAVIKTAHIADLAVSGAKIANASISSAKIISLDASKITVGTLTGFTLNGSYINGGRITSSGTVGELAINSASLTVHNDKVVGGQTQRAVVALSNEQQDFPGLRVWHGVVNSSGVVIESLGSTNITPQNGITTSKPLKVGGVIITGGSNIQNTVSNIMHITDAQDNAIDLGVRNLIASGNISGAKVVAGHLTLDGGNNIVSNSNSNINFKGANGAFMNISANTLQCGNQRMGSGSTFYSLDGRKLWFGDANDNPVDIGVRTVQQTSHIRYKENFLEISEYEGLKMILQTDIVRYNFKGDSEPHLGLIIDDAHQRYAVNDMFVSADRSSKKDSDIIGALMLSIKYLHGKHFSNEQQLASVTQQLTTMANSRLQHSLLLESKLLSLEETVVQLKQEIEQLRTA